VRHSAHLPPGGLDDWQNIFTLIEGVKAALKLPKHFAFLRELHAAEEKRFQESLPTCENAKQEMIRLEAEQLTTHARCREARARRERHSRRHGVTHKAVPDRIYAHIRSR